MKRRQNSLPLIPHAVADDHTAHDWESPQNDESREALIASTVRTEPYNIPILAFLDNRIAKPAVLFIFAIVSRIDDMVNQDEVNKGSRHVPAFYAFHNLTVFMVTLQVGILFGSIHCFGWNLPFPSRAELILCRVFSVIIAVVPWVWFALSWLKELEAETRFKLFWDVMEYLAYFLNSALHHRTHRSPHRIVHRAEGPSAWSFCQGPVGLIFTSHLTIIEYVETIFVVTYCILTGHKLGSALGLQILSWFYLCSI